MAVSPDEIRAQSFALVARGYDPAEVRAFLARVAEGQEAAGPWTEVEERLVLVLEAARRAVEAVRAETERTASELRRAVREELAAAVGELAARPATAPAPEPEVDRVRGQLATALAEVEAALGALGETAG
jgi:DivIVA domain-containing protein